MERVLVTGAGSWVGGQCVQALQYRAEVVAVDEVNPRAELDAEFHRYSLDSLEFAHFLLKVDPTIVLHLQTLDRTAELGRARAREGAVLGAQSLFGAIARSKRVRHVVVKSDTAIYSTGPRHASILSEATRISGSATRYERNLREIEQFVRELDSELPDKTFTVLRLATIIGPTIANPLSRYLARPVVPTSLGYDPRLQFLAENDAVTALLTAASSEIPGIFNVSGAGSIYLHRGLRLGLKLAQPLPPGKLRRIRRTFGVGGEPLPTHLGELLKYGRYCETERMQQVLGFAPARTTRESLLDLFAGVTV